MTAIELPPLPYADDALAPVISAETISYHYGKHHAAYVANLNKLLGDKGAPQGLEAIIQSAEPGPLFNNAAQVWNHTFYWHSMTPGGGGAPTGDIAAAIDQAFGSYDQFRTQFLDKATTLFGSGWTWLVRNGSGALEIQQTKDADLPLKHGSTALLVADVWEHAYYVDHRNDRKRYLEGWLDQLVNWEFAAKNLAG